MPGTPKYIRTNMNDFGLAVAMAMAISLAASLTQANNDICGFAPLCGTSDSSFDWVQGNVEVLGSGLLGYAELSFNDCCSLKDTVPQLPCQIVNPSGESARTLTASSPLCTEGEVDCYQGECSDYQLLIKPTFIASSQAGSCCQSCSCFGDPECISFSGERDIWILCDGREVPTGSSKYCRITKETCLKETDPAGNQCMYLANDPKGYDWDVQREGSPCRPNPISPPSIMTMYSVPDAGFEVRLEQGERGIIKSMNLTLSSGNFILEADQCLTTNDLFSAWRVESTEIFPLGIPEFFSYNDLVKGRDIHWSIVDPDSGIAVSIRCLSNKIAGDEGLYVTRLNIEDISDPLAPRASSHGYCVTSKFDTGFGTTAHTDHIYSGDLCVQGLQEAENRDIYAAICRNPALPSSGQESCIYLFCSANYAPLFNSIEECENSFKVSLAQGYCQGITYSTIDAEKCFKQWATLGALATIDEYYNDREGCLTTADTSLELCQSGIVIQTLNNNIWTDTLAIPNDFCSDDVITISFCDEPALFNKRMRVVQKAANVACGPVNQCTTIDGFQGYIGIAYRPPTTDPTVSPTFFPTTSNPKDFPTKSPTDFPTTLNPTKTPISFPTTLSPTKSPTNFPTTLNPTKTPTNFPTTLSPTKAPTNFPTTLNPTKTPTNFTTQSPTRFPTLLPTPATTTSTPTQEPTEFPSQLPTISSVYFPTESPTEFPTDLPTLRAV